MQGSRNDEPKSSIHESYFPRRRHSASRGWEGWPTVAGITVVILIAGTLLVLWINPTRSSERLSIVSGCIQTVGVILLVANLRYTSKSVENTTNSLIVSQQTLEHTRRSQADERFSRAIEQLGNESKTIRIGGLYTLRDLAVAERSPYRTIIIDLLMNYLQVITPIGSQRELSALRDVQVTIDILMLRPEELDDGKRRRLVFRNLDLRYVSFDHGWLSECKFIGCDLDHASFVNAVLYKSQFRESTSCVGAAFDGATLAKASFHKTDLRQATFFSRSHQSGPALSLNAAAESLNKIVNSEKPKAVILESELGVNHHKLHKMALLGCNTKQTSLLNCDLSTVIFMSKQQFADAKTDHSTIPPSKFFELPDPIDLVPGWTYSSDQ